MTINDNLKCNYIMDKLMKEVEHITSLLSSGYSKGGSINVWLTSSLIGLEMYFKLGALKFVLHRGTFLNWSNRSSTVQ